MNQRASAPRVQDELIPKNGFDKDSTPKLEYVYRGLHWPRVLGVAAVLILVVLAGTVLFSGDDGVEQIASEAIEHGGVQDASDSGLEVKNPAPPAAENAVETGDTAASMDSSGVSSVVQSTGLTKANPVQAIDDEPAGKDQLQQPNPVSDPVSRTDPAQVPDKSATQAPEKNIASRATDNRSGELITLEQQIRSEKVQDFKLTNAVVDKTPQGDVSDVMYDDNGILTLYAWSDIRDMKDEFIHYRWLHEGTEIADVKIGVWSNRWRSYARKYITQSKRGDWRVELTDGKGELLASARFRY